MLIHFSKKDKNNNVKKSVEDSVWLFITGLNQNRFLYLQISWIKEFKQQIKFVYFCLTLQSTMSIVTSEPSQVFYIIIFWLYRILFMAVGIDANSEFDRLKSF